MRSFGVLCNAWHARESAQGLAFAEEMAGLHQVVRLSLRGKQGFRLILTVLLLVFSMATPGLGEKPQAFKNQPALASQTESFGPVVPGKLGAPATVMVPFRLPISRAIAVLGYRVTAISSFVFVPSIPAAGAKSVTASDLLVGITNVSSTLGASSRAVIATGFDYDPTSVRGVPDAHTFSVAATVRATLADLLLGREILHAERSTTAAALPAAGGNLTFSVGIAVPNHFFTPGSFSGTISLIVSQ
ncbi:MAG: hypothetical protein ABI693_17930 [Bryobacteraceae bacterium]